MSGRIVGEVFRYSPADLTQLELVVLLALAEAAGHNDRIARHGIDSESLADKCKSTPGTIRNTLKRLRDRGLIVALYEKPRKGLAQNYRLPTLTDATRRAVLYASPHSDAIAAP